MFYSADGMIGATIEPAPGRLAIFDASIQHVGRPPSRLIKDGRRLTLTLKLGPGGVKLCHTRQQASAGGTMMAAPLTLSAT